MSSGFAICNAEIFDMEIKDVDEIESKCIIRHLVTEEFFDAFYQGLLLFPLSHVKEVMLYYTCKEYYEKICGFADRGYKAPAIWSKLRYGDR